MPKDIINYSNTIIYKLVCNDLDIKDCYVGHTTNFIKRKQHHKERCINPNNDRYHLKVYQIMRQNGGWYNWSMIEIEKYNCNDNNEARARERYWYELLSSKMNDKIPLRTKEEFKKMKSEKDKRYREKHKEDLKIKDKEYYEKNKETIKLKNNCVHTCICGSDYTHCNKARHEKSKKHQEFVNQNRIE